MNHTRLPVAVGLLLALARVAGGAPAVPNRPPLRPTPLIPLPLGTVRPAGWLLTELHLQRDGLTGHAEQVIPQLGPDSGWLGGTAKGADDWEKGPYYVKGLVALAYTLDDPGLERKAQKWVDWAIASQRPDGSFGPRSNDDWWPRMVMTYALREYAEATGDPRVVPMLRRYLAYAAAALPRRPLHGWAKARAGDQIDTAFWVYNRTGDPAAVAAADVLHTQAYDWTDVFTASRYLTFGDDLMPKHGVNVAQAMKMPPVWYQRSGRPADRDAFAVGLTHLLRGTTLPLSVPTATEYLAGRSAGQGVETCTVVEQMLSDETAVAVLGDAAIADALERTAYNALPGALTKDLKLYQYYTATNNVSAVRGGRGFDQDYPDGMMPGPVSGYPCCCYNLHMGWPMLVQHAWMATDGGGLAAVVYAPTTVHATLPAAGDVTVAERTDYPFDGAVHLTVSVPRPATFPLQLRVPGWGPGATLSVNGRPESAPVAGTFATVARRWSDGDRVDLNIRLPVTTVPGVNGSVSVARGPLVFSLRMPEHERVVTPGPDGFVHLEVTSPDPWNFALDVDPAHPAATAAVHAGPMPAGNPFVAADSPVTLTVPGRRVPSWGLGWTGRVANDPPPGPVTSDAPEQTVTLVPFGAQTLRVTAFPRLGPPPAPAAAYRCDFADVDAPGWVFYGGGWYVADGRLHAASNAGGGGYGTAGVKAVATATDFADLTYDADLIPAPSGDTGLVFRVARPAIGPNAFDGYYAGVSPATGRVTLGKGDAATNAWTPLAQADAVVRAGVPVHLRIVAVGPSIRVYVGDAPRPTLAATDASFARGAVGVRQYTTDPKGTVAAFAHVAVTRP